MANKKLIDIEVGLLFKFNNVVYKVNYMFRDFIRAIIHSKVVDLTGRKKIPKYVIVVNKKELQKYLKNNPKCIVKDKDKEQKEIENALNKEFIDERKRNSVNSYDDEIEYNAENQDGQR